MKAGEGMSQLPASVQRMGPAAGWWHEKRALLVVWKECPAGPIRALAKKEEPRG